jgi:hypothetical protein
MKADKEKATVKNEGIELNINSKPRIKSGFNCPQFNKQAIIPNDKWNDKNSNEFFKADVINDVEGNKFMPMFYTGALVEAHQASKSKIPLFVGNKLNPILLWNNGKNGLTLSVE